MKVIIEKLTDT